MTIHAVEVRDLFCLHRGQGGDVVALRGLSLSVEPGERVLVHGPNGSGKTTLLRVLLGEQPASAGVIRLAGLPIGTAGTSARRVGYVEQSAARVLLPELSALDNVALQLRLTGTRTRAARQQAREVLGELGLAHLADRSPVALSGGEAQQIGVAAAVAHGPSLLLADEPSGALDRAAADAVYDLLSSAAAVTGAALLLVSHDEGAARAADRVVRLRDGRVSERWTPGQAQETLVVDDRGWVRLPEPLRRAAGAGTGVVPSFRDGVIRLSGTDLSGTDLSGTDGYPSTRSEHSRRTPEVHSSPHRVVAQVEDVSLAYPGRPVLREVSLEVRAGALTVVTGRSGAGKTTLLRLLTGLQRPDRGRIVVEGSDLADLDRVALADLRRAGIAYAGQSVQLAEALLVRETLVLARSGRGLPADDEEVQLWLDALDLGDLADREVRLLSGGERQRLGVARALAVRARLVVVDEPTAQLDETHAELLVQALQAAVTTGAAVVAATHDPVLSAAAHRTLVLG